MSRLKMAFRDSNSLTKSLLLGVRLLLLITISLFATQSLAEEPSRPKIVFLFSLDLIPEGEDTLEQRTQELNNQVEEVQNLAKQLWANRLNNQSSVYPSLNMYLYHVLRKIVQLEQLSWQQLKDRPFHPRLVGSSQVDYLNNSYFPMQELTQFLDHPSKDHQNFLKDFDQSNLKLLQKKLQRTIHTNNALIRLFNSHQLSLSNQHILMGMNLDEYIRRRLASIDSEYEIEVIMQASANEASKYLNDRNTLAFIWVSHATRQESSLAGGILDAHGNNIAPIFSQVHDRLGLLRLVGCHASSTIDRYISLSSYANAPLLQTAAPDSKVDLIMELEQAVNDVRKYVSVDGHLMRTRYWPATWICSGSKESITLVVERSAKEQPQPSLMLTHGEKFLGFVPQLPPHQHQYIELEISIAESLALETILITPLSEPGVMNKISIFPKVSNFRGNIEWKPVLGSNNEPLGTTRMLYKKASTQNPIIHKESVRFCAEP